jgi:hypothetical protein
MRSNIFIYIYFLIFSFLSLFIINDSFIYLLTHKILNLFNYIYIYITFNLYLEFSIYIMFLIKKILDQLLLYKLQSRITKAISYSTTSYWAHLSSLRKKSHTSRICSKLYQASPEFHLLTSCRRKLAPGFLSIENFPL